MKKEDATADREDLMKVQESSKVIPVVAGFAAGAAAMGIALAWRRSATPFEEYLVS